ncbi:hypothetical protein LCGC14_1760020, partial [marine sediment metagenome]
NKSTRSPTASRCAASKEQVHAPLGNPSDSPRGRSGASPSAPVVRFGKRSEAAKVQN